MNPLHEPKLPFLKIGGDTAMNYELRQYSFGETIGKGINLYFDNFVVLVLVSLICHLPLLGLAQVVGVVFPAQNTNLETGPAWPLLGEKMLMAFVMIIIISSLSAFVFHVVSRRVLGKETLGVENSLLPVMAKVFPIILLSFMIGIYMCLWSLLFIIPGIIAYLRYIMAPAVLVVENTRVKEALQRSKTLTKGHKWRIFGWYLIAYIINACINQPLLFLTGILIKDSQIMTAVNYLVISLTSPIYPCILTVIYFNLRIEKEGFNIEHLTQQFASTGEPENPLNV